MRSHSLIVEQVQACDLGGEHKIIDTTFQSVNVLGLQPPKDMEAGIPLAIKYSPMYVRFIKNPRECMTMDAFFRKTMPTRDLPLARTLHPSDCEAFMFVHKLWGGIAVLVNLVVVIGSFIIGGVWSRYDDANLAWATALSGGALVIAYITLVTMNRQRL